MKLRFVAAIAAIATLSAGSAFAAPIVAKLQTPVSGKAKLIAGGAVFSCEADACTSNSPSSSTYATSTCKTIANKFGPVVSFTGRKSLEADRLADCNAKAGAKAGGAEAAAQ
jgi:hypothetical protein